MANFNTSFPDGPSSDSVELQHHHATSPSPFQKFVGVFQKLFNVNQSAASSIESHLTGHINELKTKAEEVLLLLEQIRQDLTTHVTDPDLIKHIEAVVDPLINRIQNTMNKDVKRIAPHNQENLVSTAIQGHIVAFQSQLDKAKFWVEFFSVGKNDRQKISEAVIQHVVDSVQEQVDKERQILESYRTHDIDQLSLSEGDKVQLKAKIKMIVEEQLKGLELKAPKTLDDLSSWKEKIDKVERPLFFNSTVHAIDLEIQQYSQFVPSPETASEHLRLNIEQVAYLEEVAPQLIAAIRNEKPDDARRKELQVVLYTLEDDAKQLEQELRLTPELEERLHNVKKILLQAERSLQQS